MQILLTLSYDGTAYAGWQRQINGIAVQQKLEETLSFIMGKNIIVRAASRTDAGVHALGQKAAFEAEGLKIPLEKLPQVLNGYLPKDISVVKAQTVSDSFNPRFDVLYKTYCYQLHNASCPNPFINRYSVFIPQNLDFALMQKAAGYFIGRHDFMAFCAAGGNKMDGKSSIREIYACSIEKKDEQIALTLRGNGFLFNMVRIIAGTVLYAGLGKIRPEEIPDIFLSKDRTRAGKTMPPEGLTLVEVVYPYSVFLLSAAPQAPKT